MFTTIITESVKIKPFKNHQIHTRDFVISLSPLTKKAGVYSVPYNLIFFPIRIFKNLIIFPYVQSYILPIARGEGQKTVYTPVFRQFNEQTSPYLQRINIVCDDDELSLLLFDEGGHGVDSVANNGGPLGGGILLKTNLIKYQSNYDQ